MDTEAFEAEIYEGTYGAMMKQAIREREDRERSAAVRLASLRKMAEAELDMPTAEEWREVAQADQAEGGSRDA